MINVAGFAHRAFIFPANLPLAFAYYSDFNRILGFLPHVYLTRDYDTDRFRVCYTSTELGIYQINIFADLKVQLDDKVPAIRLKKLPDIDPVKSQAGFNSSTAAGSFASESLFYPSGKNKTKINYKVEISAKLPTPLGLKFMPSKAVDSIANRITHYRIDEIAEGFIKRSINAFPDWLSEFERINKSS